MNSLSFQQIRSLGLLLLSLILAACGSSESPALPTPARAAVGQNTFLYLYTDN